MASVALDRINKTYPGRVRAVRDISLDIADGEFVVLVGPSGCGKSSTLRMIAGLEEVDSGTISIGDRIVNTVHPKDRDIAMVFQNYALYPHMSVYGNMAFALKLRRIPKPEIERRVHEAARLLAIEDLLQRKPRALSGGQRQRAAVGRAIVRDPACFLFDEPLSNLDVKLRVQMRAEIKALHLRLKTTTVYVTHDQEEAMTLGDKIAVMCDGEIQQIAPPLDVYRNPCNRFVAGFIGMPPMNFIEGRIERAGGDLTFSDGGDLRVTVPRAIERSIETHTDRAVTLGVRPESLHIAHPFRKGTDAGHLHMCIRVVEPLGDRVDIFGETTSGTALIARVDAAAPVEVGALLTLSFRDEQSLHFFEPGAFGRRLNADGGNAAMT